MKLGEAIEGFKLAMSPKWSKATRRNYRQRLEIVEMYFGAERDVRTIRKTELQKWVESLMERGERYVGNPYRQTEKGDLSESTINSYVQAACALFTWCASPEQKLGMENPAHKLQKPKIPDQDPKAIDDKDAERLLEFAEGDNPERDLAIMWMLRSTGARVGGVAGLVVSKLDLQAGYATVTEKGRKSRKVFLIPDAVAAMRRWLRVRPTVNHDYVFTTKTGAPITPGAIAQILKRRKKDAGITGRANPHSFRHGAGRQWTKNGAPLGIVSALLGHSDSRTTTKYYLRFTDNELAEQHAKFTSTPTGPGPKSTPPLVENDDLLTEREQVMKGKRQTPLLRRVK